MVKAGADESKIKIIGVFFSVVVVAGVHCSLSSINTYMLLTNYCKTLPFLSKLNLVKVGALEYSIQF